MKKTSFYILMLVLLFALSEATIGLFLTINKNKFTFRNSGSYLISQDKAQYVKEHFDKDLGWLTVYRTKYGERPRKTEYKESLMATFGDSFTHCAEVDDNESWQEYLAALIGENVYNFGVDAYGPDQALLRFRRDYPKVKTRIVTLGIISENINRIVNNYRKFLYEKTNMPATKPRFDLEGESLILQKNPVQSKEEVTKLSDPKFLSEIGRNDYWYNLGDMPELRFPYSRILVNKFFWSEIMLKVRKRTVDELQARPSSNLWSDKNTVMLMMKIIDRFVDESRAVGATPVIMMLPMSGDVKYLINEGKNTEAVESVVSYCKTKKYLLFDGVKAMLQEAGNEKDVDSFFKVVHSSPKGNHLLAQHFLKFLNEEGLYAN